MTVAPNSNLYVEPHEFAPRLRRVEALLLGDRLVVLYSNRICNHLFICIVAVEGVKSGWDTCFGQELVAAPLRRLLFVLRLPQVASPDGRWRSLDGRHVPSSVEEQIRTKAQCKIACLSLDMIQDLYSGTWRRGSGRGKRQRCSWCPLCRATRQMHAPGRQKVAKNALRGAEDAETERLASGGRCCS